MKSCFGSLSPHKEIILNICQRMQFQRLVISAYTERHSPASSGLYTYVHMHLLPLRMTSEPFQKAQEYSL